MTPEQIAERVKAKAEFERAKTALNYIDAPFIQGGEATYRDDKTVVEVYRSGRTLRVRHWNKQENRNG